MKLETHAWPASYGEQAKPRVGFFTDTSVCIGCKACEVACKEWNQIPMSMQGFTGNSYDNTVDARRQHLAPRRVRRAEAAGRCRDGRLAGAGRGARAAVDERGVQTYQEGDGIRWLMASDVCKHCTDAACLEVCPTGALFRTEFGTVVVQEDVCNGCGYCVPACPFGVLDRREERRPRVEVHALLRPAQGRQGAGLRTGLPDQLDPVRRADRAARARRAAAAPSCRRPGRSKAQLYLADEDDGVGGAGAFFLLLDEPEVYGLPPDPVDTVRDMGAIWAAAGRAALALGAGARGGRVRRAAMTTRRTRAADRTRRRALERGPPTTASR